MTRLLVLFALFLVVVYLLADRLALLLGGARNPRVARAPSADRAVGGARELVACARCGVHVPRPRALEIRPSAGAPDTRFCCSESCRERLVADRR